MDAMILAEAVTEFVKDNLSIILISSITVIQISPIKIDPWTLVFKKLGDWINGDIKQELIELKKNSDELKRDFEETKAQDKRWHILSFANSCRNGKRHSKDEWEHLITELREYEEYTKRKNIPNGVFEEDAKYLRSLYQKISMENDFL